jgi:hypothetical protein
MIFNRHFLQPHQHALLSASKPAWLNYDDEKVIDYFKRQEAAKRGTRLHAFAMEAISLGEKLPNSRRTLNMYVNDAISYRMVPEQTLKYSDNAFGTPDAISYRERADGLRFLRISDLKTGETPAKPDQLMVYAALFLLEYGDLLGITANDVITELRIYQSNEVFEFLADPEEVMWVMARIIHIDRIIEAAKEVAL